MIGAGDAALFDTAVAKRNAPMGAAVIEQTDPAAFVAKQDKSFTENLYHLGGILRRKLAGDSDRKPVAA